MQHSSRTVISNGQSGAQMTWVQIERLGKIILYFSHILDPTSKYQFAKIDFYHLGILQKQLLKIIINKLRQLYL